MKSVIVFSTLFFISSFSFAMDIVTSMIPKRGAVLVVVSSQSSLGNSEIKTGVWLPDVAHPYAALTNGGFQIEFASPSGGNTPIEATSDPRTGNALNKDDLITRAFITNEAAMAALNNAKPLKDVEADRYIAILLVGGMGAMYDFPNNADLARVLKSFWDQGKFISSLHYGAYAFVNLKTASGRNALRGVEITGISKAEEQRWAELLGWDVKLLTPNGYLQDIVKNLGGGFKSGPPFTSYTYTTQQGRLITGQQPFSALELGSVLAKAYTKKLKPYVPKIDRLMAPKLVGR